MEALFDMRNATPQDDRTILTIDLTREELALLFEGVRCHRIKATRALLAACKERRRAARRNRKKSPGPKRPGRCRKG